MGEDNIDRYPLMNPVAIPEFPGEEDAPDDSIDWTSLNITLIAAAVLIMLAIIWRSNLQKKKEVIQQNTLMEDYK